MSVQTARLIDSNRQVVATAEVEDDGDRFWGTIDLGATPNVLRRLFDEFEEIVNGQMFSFLDEIQDKISAIPLTVVFADGQVTGVKDLQVYPSTGDFSFKLCPEGARL